MLNMPILKFEKSSKFLESQLEVQSNNKQLILDIITNIGLIISTSSKETKNDYTFVLESANKFLHSISSNITAIEQLNLEISNITKELSDLLQEQTKATKTKEYYIAAFSNIKQNIILYSKKFQNIEEKLNRDNKDFNEFIKINNFKYNFNSTNTSENYDSYKLTSFSVNDSSEDIATDEITVDDIPIEDITDFLEDSIELDDINLDVDNVNISTEKILTNNITSIDLDIINDDVVDTDTTSTNLDITNNDVVDTDTTSTNLDITNNDVVDTDATSTNLDIINDEVIDTTATSTNLDITNDDVVDTDTTSTNLDITNDDVVDTDATSTNLDITNDDVVDTDTTSTNLDITNDAVIDTDNKENNNFINNFMESIKFNTQYNLAFNEKIDKLTNEFKQFLLNLSTSSTETTNNNTDINSVENTEAEINTLEEATETINDINITTTQNTSTEENFENTDETIEKNVESSDVSDDELLLSLSDDDMVNEILLDSVSDIDLNIENNSIEENSNTIDDTTIPEDCLENNTENIDNITETITEESQDIINNFETENHPLFNLEDIDFTKNKTTFYSSDFIFDLTKTTRTNSPVLFKINPNAKPEPEEIFEEYIDDIDEDDNIDIPSNIDVIAENIIDNIDNNISIDIDSNNTDTTNDNIEVEKEQPIIPESVIEELNDIEDILIENLSDEEIANSILQDTESTQPPFFDIEQLISNINNTSDIEEKTTNSIENKFKDIKSTFNEIEEIINNKKAPMSSPIDNYDLNIKVDTSVNNPKIQENNFTFDKSEIDLFNIDLASAVEQNIIGNYISQPIENTEEEIEIVPEESDTNDYFFDFDKKSNSEESVDIITNFDEDIDIKIEHILNAETDNDNLIISEKHQKIYLPYKISELLNYIDSYPNVYSSLQDVVKQEFILPFDYFIKHPYKSRFSETYNILKNREGKNAIKAFCYSLNVSKRNNLNPAIIAACKSLNELETYLYYLDSNNLKRFKFFNIIYEVNLS